MNFEGNSQNYPTSFNYAQPSQSNFSTEPINQQNYGEYGSGCGYSHQSTPGGGRSTDENYALDDDADDDDEEEELDVPCTQMNYTDLLTQPTFQSAPHPTPKPTEEPDKKIWDDAETTALISVYMNTTNDQIIGTNQKSNVFWQRVLASYEDARKSNPKEIPIRTVGSLKGRWLRIAPAVVKWCGSIDKARMCSGQNADDVIAEAHKIHKNSYGKFQFYKEWLQLKKWDRYCSILEQKVHVLGRGRPSKKPTMVNTPESDSSGKRSRDEDGGLTPNTPTSGDVFTDEFVPRPDDSKKAKSRLKGKEVTTQALDTFESFGDKLKLYGEMRDKAVDRDLERLELEKKKEARKQKQIELKERNIQMQQYKMNWDLLQQLLAKEVRAPWEDQMIIELQEYLSKFKAF
ncbi:glutathione S-transferase T3-like [Chenopodium quinoa]|uniref:glutathione S-transferase T3-like n=1 Tax=Chenopodium quinoa TaxID=63459 RepID=UPI000B773BC2|nr:glutathione S-transferase T3-like [Chenopodium quinoa]